MASLAVSLWLPIGRTNFYNHAADRIMLGEVRAGQSVTCRAEQTDDTLQLQVSVLRRLLEVLPRFFGYEAEGTCATSQKFGDAVRPIAVVMVLRPHAIGARSADQDPIRTMHQDLMDAGIDHVSLRVDENGNYTFIANVADGLDERSGGLVLAALRRHAQEVFGGDFKMDRLSKEPEEGTVAIRRYAGLDADTGTTAAGRPRGALSFFQLNLIVEGLCNESLLPAYFLEARKFVQRWLGNRHRAAPILNTIGDLVAELATDVDAAEIPGQIVALHRFLSVTSRETLQRLQWSVESARRSLFDLMISVLHRQTHLVQLNLSASPALRTPELAEEANESQLRGYVMLVGAKLPVVANAGAIVDLAVAHIQEHAGSPASASPHAEMVNELVTQQRYWHALLEAVRANVHHLDNAVTHEWRENLLHEQQQTRSEQEAMAEIERSRRGRFEIRKRVGDSAYSALMVVLTIFGVLYAVNNPPPASTAGPADWFEFARSLWPVILVAFLVPFVLRAMGAIRQLARDRRGASEIYSYEFAFRLDEPASVTKINNCLNGNFAYLKRPGGHRQSGRPAGRSRLAQPNSGPPTCAETRFVGYASFPPEAGALSLSAQQSDYWVLSSCAGVVEVQDH